MHSSSNWLWSLCALAFAILCATEPARALPDCPGVWGDHGSHGACLCSHLPAYGGPTDLQPHQSGPTLAFGRWSSNSKRIVCGGGSVAAIVPPFDLQTARAAEAADNHCPKLSTEQQCERDGCSWTVFVGERRKSRCIPWPKLRPVTPSELEKTSTWTPAYCRRFLSSAGEDIIEQCEQILEVREAAGDNEPIGAAAKKYVEENVCSAVIRDAFAAETKPESKSLAQSLTSPAA